MSTNEDMPAIPATDNTEQYISQAGIYLLQPIRIAPWKDTNGVLKKDKNGNPGLLITFKDEKTGGMLSTGFYYSELPMGDPRRQDDAYRCKSEFQLANLKTAMGFKPGVVVQSAEFLTKKVWVPVKEVQYYTPEGEYVKSLCQIINKFHPYLPDATTKGKPSILGDPATNADGKPSHDFVEIRTDLTQAAAPAPKKKFKPTPVEEQDDTGSTGEEPQADMPSAKREEPPDY
ncbi:MAG: hypothetical protein WC222_11500 [Parachlamydiales bacterium]|jgi:hypothetical protein